MKRVAVFGNSHTAALMFGWRMIAADYPALRVTFFAAPSGKMRGLKAAGDRLVPDNADLTELIETTSGGQKSVNLADFDALLFVGMGVGEYRVSMIYQTHQPLGVRTVNAKAALISDACLDVTMDAYLSRTDTFRLIRLAQRIRALPCVVVPDPRPTKQIERGPEPSSIWRSAAARDSIARHFYLSLRRCAEQHGAAVLDQPAETFDSFYTKDEYGRGSQTLRRATEHAEDEPHHMNGEYGALVLKALAASLGA